MLIIYSRMEELVTLQYGNFTMLGEWMQRNSPRGLAVPAELPIKPSGVNFFSMQAKTRTPRLEYCPQTRVGSLSAGAPAPQCSFHEEKRVTEGALWAPQAGDMAKLQQPLNTPHVWTLLGSTDVEILKDCWAGLPGGVHNGTQCAPHQWDEECISELCQELAKCMARAGLQNEPGLARPTARSRRCSHRCSASWAHPPLSWASGGRVS